MLYTSVLRVFFGGRRNLTLADSVYNFSGEFRLNAPFGHVTKDKGLQGKELGHFR